MTTVRNLGQQAEIAVSEQLDVLSKYTAKPRGVNVTRKLAEDLIKLY